VARIEEKINVHSVFVTRQDRKRSLGKSEIDWKMILKRIFEKWNGGCVDYLFTFFRTVTINGLL
jgi:predicted metal-dependent peptidase